MLLGNLQILFSEFSGRKSHGFLEGASKILCLMEAQLKGDLTNRHRGLSE